VIAPGSTPSIKPFSESWIEKERVRRYEFFWAHSLSKPSKGERTAQDQLLASVRSYKLIFHCDCFQLMVFDSPHDHDCVGFAGLKTKLWHHQ